jgi:septum formation protein
MDILNAYHLILGSASPRRREILTAAGIDFTQKVIEVEESYPEDLVPDQVPEYLAVKKAQPFIPLLKEKEIVLTSDSVVILGNKIMGKPKDRNDAFHMLSALSNKEHRVITGVCLTHMTKQLVFNDVSKVYFDQLSEEEINFYLDHFQPYDKAGSYGIQEWIGHCKILKIEGSYLNIVGLPMAAVYRNLHSLVKELDSKL